MPIQHGSKKVKEVYHGSKKVKEVYQGSKKVYSSDKTVPPYAMLHVIDKQSPLQRTYVNTSADMVEKSGSIGPPVKTRKGIIQCLMADDQSLVFKNDSFTSMEIKRTGLNVTCTISTNAPYSESVPVSLTLNETTSKTMPYTAVAVQLTETTTGFTFRMLGNNDSVSNTGTFSNSSSNPYWFSCNNYIASPLTFGIEIEPFSTRVYDWRYTNTTEFGYNASAYFTLARTKNIAWDDFFGQPRKNQALPANQQADTGLTTGLCYANPDFALAYSYTKPDGVTYSEQFHLSGGSTDAICGGGAGGTGGRSANATFNGNCINISTGASGSCNPMSGVGSDGAVGSLFYSLLRNKPLYYRTNVDLSKVSKVYVGRGSQFLSASYWDDKDQSSNKKNAGGAGGAGGVWNSVTPNSLIGGSVGVKPARDASQKDNNYYYPMLVKSDGSNATYPSYQDTLNGYTKFNNQYGDPYLNQANYDAYNSKVPTEMLQGVEYETFVPAQDCTKFTLSDTYWAKNLSFYRVKRSVQFYSTHSGTKVVWPPEPTAKNRAAEYADIAAPAESFGGSGGKGGQPGMTPKANGRPGTDGKSGYMTASGTGVVVFYYEFEAPKVV